MDHKDTFTKPYSNFILVKKTCFWLNKKSIAHSDKFYLKLFLEAKEKIYSKSDLVSLKFWYDWAGQNFYLYSLIHPAVVVLVLRVHIRTLCNLNPCKFSNGA